MFGVHIFQRPHFSVSTLFSVHSVRYAQCSASTCFSVHLYQRPHVSASTFFSVHILQRSRLSAITFFSVHMFQRPYFPVSTFFSVHIFQCPHFCMVYIASTVTAVTFSIPTSFSLALHLNVDNSIPCTNPVFNKHRSAMSIVLGPYTCLQFAQVFNVHMSPTSTGLRHHSYPRFAGLQSRQLPNFHRPLQSP